MLDSKIREKKTPIRLGSISSALAACRSVRCDLGPCVVANVETLFETPLGSVYNMRISFDANVSMSRVRFWNRVWF